MLRSGLMTALIAVALPSAALADEVGGEAPWASFDAVAMRVFETLDTSGRDVIDLGQVDRFGRDVHVSMDGDQDGSVSGAEFAVWDPGFALIAEDTGRAEQHSVAMRVVFAFWDRDGDGMIRGPEMGYAINADFRRADLDNNGLLTPDEFTSGFAVISAARIALQPSE